MKWRVTFGLAVRTKLRHFQVKRYVDGGIFHRVKEIKAITTFFKIYHAFRYPILRGFASNNLQQAGEKPSKILKYHCPTQIIRAAHIIH